MCTVTVVRIARAGEADRIRLACNRDESPRRAAALPPRIHELGPLRAVYPLDPQSGGTWIGVNQAGLLATLLNRNLPPGASPAAGRAAARRSRGEIVPLLLAAGAIGQARRIAEALPATEFPPFRAVVLNSSELFELRSDGQALVLAGQSLAGAPLLFTSSGLGDHVVEPPRRALFDELFAQAGDPIEIQERFHRHSWPQRRHLSVCMSRESARTVSSTVIEIGAECALLRYCGAPPDAADQPLHTARLALAAP